MPQFNYKIIVAYDGTNYSGWQIQSNSSSIQEIIQTLLEKILQESVKVIGSGRTDAGVHALGQTAHFKTQKKVDEQRILKSLNALLPPDIRILSMEQVTNDFHSQYGTTTKIYRYHISLNPVLNPFRRLYCWQIKTPLQLNKIKKAATYFIGTHDFTTFANEARTGVAAYDSVRTINRLDITEQNGEIELEFEGDGFLYKMVRNIVGTLIEVGQDKIQPENISTLIAAKDRRLAGMAAPPNGLFLVQVNYKESTSSKSFKLL